MAEFANVTNGFNEFKNSVKSNANKVFENSKQNTNQQTNNQQQEIQQTPINEQQVSPELLQQYQGIQPNQQQKNSISKAGIVKAGIGIAIIGGTILIGRKIHLSKNPMKLLEKNITQLSGNNSIINSSVQKSQDEINNMISHNPEIYQNIKDIIANNTHDFNFSKYAPDGLIYHGTTKENAQKIFETGISPFGAKKSKKTLEMGQGIYGCIDYNQAQSFTKEKIILPFNLTGRVVKLDARNPKDFRKLVELQLMEYIDPTTANNSTRLFGRTSYNPRAIQFASDNTDFVINKAMNELGISGMMFEKNENSSLLGKITSVFKKQENTQTLCIFDGTKLTINKDKLKEIAQKPKLFNKKA